MRSRRFLGGNASFHVFAIISIILWASAYPYTRLALHYFSSSSLGLLRSGIAAIIFLALLFIKQSTPPSRKDWKWFALSGGLGIFLYIIVFNKGCETVNSSTSSLIVATSPIFTVIFGYLFRHEHLTKTQYFSIGLELCGLAVLITMYGGLVINQGLLWLLIAAALFGVYNLLQKTMTDSYTPLQVAAYNIISGAVMLLIFLPRASLELSTAPPVQWLYLLILGVLSSAVAFISWAKAYALATKTAYVSNYMFVTPLLASVLGFIIAKEPIALPTMVGGAIILAGLVIFYFGDWLRRIIK